MPPSAKDIKLYEDVAVVKSQTATILTLLNNEAHPELGLVSRMGCAETDIKALKKKVESEEDVKKTTEVRKFEMSKGVKLAFISGFIGIAANLILTLFK